MKMIALFCLFISLIPQNSWAIQNYLIYKDKKGMPRCLESKDLSKGSVLFSWDESINLSRRHVYFRKFERSVCPRWYKFDSSILRLESEKVWFDVGVAPSSIEDFELDVPTKQALLQIYFGMNRFIPTNAYTDKTFINKIFVPFQLDTYKILLKDVGEKITTQLYHAYYNINFKEKDCKKMIGTCEYYLCRENQKTCGSPGYFIGFGYQYCSDSIYKLKNEVKEKTKTWLDTTAVCLQEKMDVIPNQLSCNKIKAEAITSHDECYSKIKFCSIDPVDIYKIIKMIHPAILEKGVLEEGIQVMEHCANL